jgi:hypothetical protein
MMAMFLVRSISEASIQPNFILGAETLAVMTYIFYTMNHGAEWKAEARGSASIGQGAGLGLQQPVRDSAQGVK